MKYISYRRGFTLIELLVVISIISLLSSVVLASVKTARDKAQQTAYRQYLGQVVNAIELYRLDNNGELYADWQYNSIGLNPATEPFNILSKYIKYQPQPKFVIDPAPSEYAIRIYFFDDYYSCESAIKDDYFLYFQSSDTNLKFPKLYEGGSVYSNGEFYCVSPSVR